MGTTAILPALVNAHTHLELSGLRGAVPPASSMPEWVGRLLARRAEAGPPDTTAIRRAIGEARACGTGLFGDIGNTLASVPILVSAGVTARVFREVLAFPDAEAAPVVKAAVEEGPGGRNDEAGLGGIGGACAILGRASRVRGARRRHPHVVRRSPVHPPGGVARRAGVPADRPRGLARAARTGWALGSGMGASGLRVGRVLGPGGVAGSRSDRGPRRAADR